MESTECNRPKLYKEAIEGALSRLNREWHKYSPDVEFYMREYPTPGVTGWGIQLWRRGPYPGKLMVFFSFASYKDTRHASKVDAYRRLLCEMMDTSIGQMYFDAVSELRKCNVLTGTDLAFHPVTPGECTTDYYE